MGAQGKGKGKGQKSDSKYIKKVDLYKFLVKWVLRSYADEGGNMLMSEGEKPSKYFTAERVRAMLDGDCCELIRRLGMGMNLSACTIEGGMAVLKRMAEAMQGANPESKSILQKTGLQQVLEWIEKEENNVANNIERTYENDNAIINLII